MQISEFVEHIHQIKASVGSVLVGQQSVVDAVLICLVTDGHVLLEGVPGLGKTLLVRALSDCLGLGFRRIQFTPDLMPADIVGTHLLDEDAAGKRFLRFEKGPVFTQLLLADEINRATPKTQSALLEAMAERQVTIGGEPNPLPQPFLVMATQNPLEQEGTYPLPEAQLDRFFFKVDVPFPTLDELAEIMARTTAGTTQQAYAAVDPPTLKRMRDLVRTVVCADEVVRYGLRLVLATHPDQAMCPEACRRFLRYGASPRGAQAIILAAKARALTQGRDHVGIKDVRAVAKLALRHRLGLTFEAEAEGQTPDKIIDTLLSTVPESEGVVRQAVNEGRRRR